MQAELADNLARLTFIEKILEDVSHLVQVLHYYVISVWDTLISFLSFLFIIFFFNFFQQNNQIILVCFHEIFFEQSFDRLKSSLQKALSDVLIKRLEAKLLRARAMSPTIFELVRVVNDPLLRWRHQPGLRTLHLCLTTLPSLQLRPRAPSYCKY